MTSTEKPLDELFDRMNGEAVGPLPDDAHLSQIALSAHPYMWALDTVVFAGERAHEATQVYAQGGRVSELAVAAYRILSTTDGVMQLHRVL